MDTKLFLGWNRSNDFSWLFFVFNALRNKFNELYRNSRKSHDNQFISEMEMLDTTTFEEKQYGDLDKYLRKYRGLRYQIYRAVLFENLSDYEIAVKYDVTRQYVYRLKKQLYSELKEKFFEIEK